MSRILKVSQSDYRLQVQSGGNIVLDTGVNTGTVTITGNLDVKGTTTTVESVNTTIYDNILNLNYNPNNVYTGAGISSALGYQAGVEIWRGSRDAAQILFTEQINHFNSVTQSEITGTFVLQTRNTITNSATVSGLSLATIANDGISNLSFDLRNAPNAILRIVNPNESGAIGSSYANRIGNPQDPLSPNDIPNLKFIYQYIASTFNPNSPGNQGTALVDTVQYPALTNVININSQLQATATSLDFRITNVLKAQVTSTGFNVGNILSLSQNTISNTSGVANLILTAANNNVQISGVLNLDDQTATPASVSGSTRIFSKAVNGVGKSALYFTNAGAATTSDELMSRRKAVVLSILL